MKSALALMALGAAAIPAAGFAQTSVTIAETAPVVTLNVTESVEAAPDIATVGTGVQTRAPTAQAAMQQNAAQTEKLIAALAKAGIAKKDIQTSGINLSAQYDYNNQDGQPQGPRFIGYEASNQLTVKLRDIKRVGGRHGGGGRDQYQRADLLDRRPFVHAGAGARSSAQEREGAGGLLCAGGWLSFRAAGVDQREQQRRAAAHADDAERPVQG